MAKKLDFSDLNNNIKESNKFDFSDLNNEEEKKDDAYYERQGKIYRATNPGILSPTSALMAQGNEVNKTLPGQIGLGAVAAIPFGLGEAPAFIASRVARSPKLLKYLAELSGVVGKNVAFGEALGQLPSGLGDARSVGEKAEESLVPSALGGALGKLGFDALSKLRPSSLLRGKLSHDELMSNLRSTEGTNTSLGDVIGSPFLKRQYENVLSKIPFSGAIPVMQETASQVKNKGENILSKILGNNNPEDANSQLYEGLLKNYEEHQSSKNSLYKNVNEIADKENLKLNLPKFSGEAKKYRDAIESTNILKYEPEIKKIFNKLENYENPIREEEGLLVDKQGKSLSSKIVPPSLKEANILKGKLNRYSRLMASSPDAEKRYIANIFNDLSSALKSDIKLSIKSHGHEPLIKAYERAEENYAKNFSPFLDKKIYKFIGGTSDPDTLVQSFVKNSLGSDRSRLAQSLIKTLPGEKKGLLAYAHLSKALDNEGHLNPSKLGTLINKLKPNQFKALIPNASIRRELRDFSKLSSMNSNILNLMHNPATGQRNLDAITGLLLGHGTAGGILGYKEGGKKGAIAGALTGLALPIAASRYAVKGLTSPSLRKSLIEKMLKKEGSSTTQNVTHGILQTLINNNEGQ
jgi:hypothetical protein